MDIAAEKLNIIQWLNDINDKKVIHQLLSLKESFEENALLEKEVKDAIDLGLRSIEQGKLRLHDEVVDLTKDKYPELFKLRWVIR